MITHPGGPDDVALYQLFDAAGRLLYVGISKDPMERWLAYRNTSWWPAVARYEWQWYPSRAAARGAEKEVLAADIAAHNIHSTPRHGEHQRAQREQARQQLTASA
jgi:hypothetical protein